MRNPIAPKRGEPTAQAQIHGCCTGIPGLKSGNGSDDEPLVPRFVVRPQPLDDLVAFK